MSYLSILTYFVCALCVIIAFGAWGHFKKKINAIRKDVKAFLSDNKMDGNIPLSQIFKNYLAGLRNGLYTTEYAADYFSIDSLSGPYGVRLKVFSVIPNILTSLGILGTFLGLSLALLKFNSTDSEAIRSSINSLVGGMSTAFWTSVAGMATSAVFLFKERKLINKTEQDIDSLCSMLDNKYRRSADQVIIDSFTLRDEEGIVTTPTDFFSSIVENLDKMKNTLELFGTDLCDSIGNAMDNSFQEKLVPIISELSNKLENPAQAVTDKLVKELAEVCNNFKNNLTESVNNQMDDLLEKFIDASNAINGIPEVMDLMSKQINDSTGVAVKSHEEISKSLDEQILRLTDLSDSFAEALEQMSSSTKNLTNVSSSLVDMPVAVMSASEAIGTASNSLKESNAHVGETLSSIQDVNSKTSSMVKFYSENIESIQNGLSGIFTEINDGLKKYAEATKTGLQQMLDPFTTSISDATIKVANSIAPLNDAVDELSSFGDTVTKSLKDLSSAIEPLERSIKQLKELKINETK